MSDLVTRLSVLAEDDGDRYPAHVKKLAEAAASRIAALEAALEAEKKRADEAEALLKDANTPYTQREIGNLVFDGNSVSFWRDKAKAYGGAASALRARVAVMQEALEIIAGKRQCLDNLMGNKDVALAALKGTS